MGHFLPPLGDLAHGLLTILWDEMSAFAVRQQVARELNDASIWTVLWRLEDKGYVTHQVLSGAFLYRVEVIQETIADTVERVCGGSLERPLTDLMDAGFIDAGQLAALRAS